jgi:hypothetical protein
MAMRAYLMTRGGDFFDNFWVSFSDKTQNEKRCMHSRFVKEGKQTPSHRNDSIFVRIPLLRRNLETLVPILEIDREGVGNLPHPYPGTS